MHIGYAVYFHEKGIGEMKWGVVVKLGADEEAKAAKYVELLNDGTITHHDRKYGKIDREKYNFYYREIAW